MHRNKQALKSCNFKPLAQVLQFSLRMLFFANFYKQVLLVVVHVLIEALLQVYFPTKSHT